MSADTGASGSKVCSEGEWRSPQGPGTGGSCVDPGATSTPGAGQAFDLTKWVGKNVYIEAEVADIYICFGSTAAKAASFDPALAAVKDAATPTFAAPYRVKVGSPMRFVIQPGKAFMAYASQTGTATVRAHRG